MTPLIVSVFLASLLGSFHCAGMCGAFVALACGAAEPSASRQMTLQTAYHLGRLATYVSLGLAAGAAGRLFDIAGSLAGLQSAAAILAATTMLLFALLAIARARGWKLASPGVPPRWMAFVQAAHRAAMDRAPLPRAAAIGLLTTLLPCGWLYAFVITAAGTANPLTAAMVMATFWAGTLPMLVAIGAGAKALLGRAGRHLPTVTAIAVAAVSIYVLVGRSRLDPSTVAAAAEGRQTTTQVGTEPACCQTDAE